MMESVKRKLPPEESDSLEANIVEIAISGGLREATRQAIADTLSRGFPVTFKRGNKIIKQYPDGREEILGTIEPSNFKFPANVAVGPKRQ